MKQTLQSAIQALGFEPEHDEEAGQVRAVVARHEGRAIMACTALVDEARQLLVTTAIISQPVPEDRLDEVVEFATRVNYSLAYGSLDVDLDEGWIQFRGGVSFGGTELSQRLVENAVVEVIEAMKELLDPLVEIIEGRMSAKVAWESMQE